LKRAVVEGSVLNVCGQCAKFGKIVEEKRESAEVRRESPRPIVSPGKSYSRDIFTEADKRVLAFDYSKRIRVARMEKGWTLEELGKVINEKKSIISKLENGMLRPDKRLVSKLEKTLKIKLMEEVGEKEVKVKKGKSRPRTLGDIVKLE
jgi:putative transcription factor